MTETATENPLLAVVAERDSQIAGLKARIAELNGWRFTMAEEHESKIRQVKDLIKANLDDDGLDRGDVIEIATILGIELTRTIQVTGTFEWTVEVPIDYDEDLYTGWHLNVTRSDDADIVGDDYTIDNVEEA